MDDPKVSRGRAQECSWAKLPLTRAKACACCGHRFLKEMLAIATGASGDQVLSPHSSQAQLSLATQPKVPGSGARQSAALLPVLSRSAAALFVLQCTACGT
jgi:hypothetical protein